MRSLKETQQLAHYLTSTLCPAMKVPVIFDEVALPTHGLKSTLLLVRPKARDPFVMRCVDSPAEASELIRLSRYAQELGLPTPRLRYTETSRSHFRQFGFGVIVEDMIEGEHFKAGELEDAQIDAAGKALAKLHFVESERWGVPGKTKGGAFFDPGILSKVEHRLASIAKFDDEFEKPWRRVILKFFKSYRKEWDGGPPYSLTHDKINTGNILFREGGDAAFVDLISLRFGAPGKDLVAAFYYFCTNTGEEARLQTAYFANLRPERKEHFTRFEPLYRAWHHLSRWASKSRAYGKQKRKRKVEVGAESQEPASRHVERDAMWKWVRGD